MLRNVKLSVLKKTAEILFGEKEKMFAVRLLENNELLGNIGFNSLDIINRNGALGVLIGNPRHQRKGYGAEALKLILDYGFSLDLFDNLV